MLSERNVPPNTASRTITGITLALPARASVMHSTPPKNGGTGVVGLPHRGVRVFRQFVWLEVGSVKVALSRITHQYPAEPCGA